MTAYSPLQAVAGVRQAESAQIPPEVNSPVWDRPMQMFRSKLPRFPRGALRTVVSYLMVCGCEVSARRRYSAESSNLKTGRIVILYGAAIGAGAPTCSSLTIAPGRITVEFTEPQQALESLLACSLHKFWPPDGIINRSSEETGFYPEISKRSTGVSGGQHNSPCGRGKSRPRDARFEKDLAPERGRILCFPHRRTLERRCLYHCEDHHHETPRRQPACLIPGLGYPESGQAHCRAGIRRRGAPRVPPPGRDGACRLGA